jgi:hypothetical protein
VRLAPCEVSSLHGARCWAASWAFAKCRFLGRRQTGRGTPVPNGPTIAPGPVARTFPPVGSETTRALIACGAQVRRVVHDGAWDAPTSPLRLGNRPCGHKSLPARGAGPSLLSSVLPRFLELKKTKRLGERPPGCYKRSRGAEVSLVHLLPLPSSTSSPSSPSQRAPLRWRGVGAEPAHPPPP